MEQIEVDLVPISIKEQIRTIKIVSYYTVGCLAVLLITMMILGFFQDTFTAIALSVIMFLVAIPLLLPGLMFEKTSQSRICFMSNQICIVDTKGKCWRSVDYNTISDLRIEDITGFFYGGNKHLYRNKYICIFLNGATEIPSVPFAKLFTEKNIIMFGYHPDALKWLQQKCCEKNS
jgi:hypothetical protein